MDRSAERASSADPRITARRTARSRSRSGNRGKTLLYVMQADGTNARIVADSLELHGAPAWAPDGQSITSAAIDARRAAPLPRARWTAAPRPALSMEYSTDPVWAPDGRFVVYSGPDIGTTFSVKAVAPRRDRVSIARR